MFDGILPNTTFIYATTAASPEQPSFACDYDNTRQTFINDCYSVNWMNNTETVNVTQETLQVQFQVVRGETSNSIVCQYHLLTPSLPT